ncbi:transposase [Pseudomonas aeruginosa]|nr:transposase [Pseudomonas aeruginosa]
MNLSRIGLDLAKQVFQVHGVDRHEHVVCRRQLKRAQVRDFFRQLPPCLVAMEACGSAHYWARELRELGHTVRLIAPQFVKPYVKGDCSGQPIPDSGLSFSSATAGGNPSLN